MTVLHTRRLTLRPWSAADVDLLHALFAEPAVRRYLCDDQVMERSWVEAQVRRSEGRFACGSLGMWTGRDEGGELVAVAGWLEGPDGTGLELSFAVSPRHLRLGYGEEAARAVIDCARAHGLGELRASTDAPNLASQRLLARLGFALLGSGPGPRWPQQHYALAPVISVRPGLDTDASAIARIHELAFGRPEEAKIVAALIAAGAATLSLVAEAAGQPVGHILFSPVRIETAAGTHTALGLAPLAVLPDHQRKGAGSRLVREGLDRARALGHPAVVVLGHSHYYPRFGFVRARHFGLRWECDCPDEAFMALELQPGTLAGSPGVVHYHPAVMGAA